MVRPQVLSPGRAEVGTRVSVHSDRLGRRRWNGGLKKTRLRPGMKVRGSNPLQRPRCGMSCCQRPHRGTGCSLKQPAVPRSCVLSEIVSVRPPRQGRPSLSAISRNCRRGVRADVQNVGGLDDWPIQSATNDRRPTSWLSLRRWYSSGDGVADQSIDRGSSENPCSDQGSPEGSRGKS